MCFWDGESRRVCESSECNPGYRILVRSTKRVKAHEDSEDSWCRNERLQPASFTESSCASMLLPERATEYVELIFRYGQRCHNTAISTTVTSQHKDRS